MPPIEAFSVLLLAALPLMGSPGPATVGSAASGATFGLRRSLPFLAGIILGTTLVLVLVSCGVTGLVLAIPGAAPVILAVGCAYILYLAYKIAAAPPISAATETTKAPTLTGGLVIGVANPKSYAVFGALLSSVVLVPAEPTLDAILKVAVLSSMIVAVNSVWLVFGATFSRVLSTPRLARAINIGFAVLLIGSLAIAVLP